MPILILIVVAAIYCIGFTLACGTLRLPRFHMPIYRNYFGRWTYSGEDAGMGMVYIILASAAIGFLVGLPLTIGVAFYQSEGAMKSVDFDTGLFLKTTIGITLYLIITHAYKWAKSRDYLRAYVRFWPSQFWPETDEDALILGFKSVADYERYKDEENTEDERESWYPRKNVAQVYLDTLKSCPLWFSRDIMWAGIVNPRMRTRFNVLNIQFGLQGDAAVREQSGFLLKAICRTLRVFGIPTDDSKVGRVLTYGSIDDIKAAGLYTEIIIGYGKSTWSGNVHGCAASRRGDLAASAPIRCFADLWLKLIKLLPAEDRLM